MAKSKNPLDYVTHEQILEMGLTEQELLEAYQPSSGGVYHARGAEGKGKTLYIADFYKYLIDNKCFTPYDAVGNLTMKGKYGYGFQTLKGDDLRQYLWDLTHKPYKNKIVIIDELDSEFPARFFADREQTEIALRLWHTAKLHNFILMSSHIGNSADLIFHLASHYNIYPEEPSFDTNSMDITIVNALSLEISDWTVNDIIPSMLIYNRKELTENTEQEINKTRPNKKEKRKEIDIIENFDLDIALEKEKGLIF